MPEHEEIKKLQRQVGDLVADVKSMKSRISKTDPYNLVNAMRHDLVDMGQVPCARMYQTGAQAIADDSLTTLTMDATEFDYIGDGVDLTNNLITVRRAGVYMCQSKFTFNAGVADINSAYAAITFAGSVAATIYGGGVMGDVVATWWRLTCINIIKLEVGDTVKAVGYQDNVAGTNRNTLVSANVSDYDASSLSVLLVASS